MIGKFQRKRESNRGGGKISIVLKTIIYQFPKKLRKDITFSNK